MLKENSEVLGDEGLRRMAPSIFVEEPYSEVSDNYAFIPTIKIIDAMRSNGFYPVQAFQSRTRIAEKRDFTKHLIRMRHQDHFDAPTIMDEAFPEIVLINSHDRSSAYELSCGVFRVVCSNGLIVKSSDFGSVKIRHHGDIIDNVIEGSYQIIEEVPALAEHIAEFQSINLEPEVRSLFANAALMLRYDSEDEQTEEIKSPITAEQLLLPHRQYDDRKDLWTTFNIIQENMMKGGIRGTTTTGRRMTTRAVNSVTANVRLNKALWMLTEEVGKMVKQ